MRKFKHEVKWANRDRQIKMAQGRIRKAFKAGKVPSDKDFAIIYMEYNGWIYEPGVGVIRKATVTVDNKGDN